MLPTIRLSTQGVMRHVKLRLSAAVPARVRPESSPVHFDTLATQGKRHRLRTPMQSCGILITTCSPMLEKACKTPTSLHRQFSSLARCAADTNNSTEVPTVEVVDRELSPEHTVLFQNDCWTYDMPTLLRRYSTGTGPVDCDKFAEDLEQELVALEQKRKALEQGGKPELALSDRGFLVLLEGTVTMEPQPHLSTAESGHRPLRSASDGNGVGRLSDEELAWEADDEDGNGVDGLSHEEMAWEADNELAWQTFCEIIEELESTSEDERPLTAEGKLFSDVDGETYWRLCSATMRLFDVWWTIQQCLYKRKAGGEATTLTRSA